MTGIFLILAWYILTVSEANLGSVKDAVVEISQGKLQGVEMKSLNGKLFHAFRGIPYAEPPVGKLRWKPPIPARGWNGTRDATVEGSICPQFLLTTDIYTGEEDCLFVNIYSRSESENRPVIIWIHGGANIAGDGGVEENGPEFLMDHDIVLVTFNYRLGPLGFLSTGDVNLPGNYGLKDQVELLKWVQKNIADFGGDPEKVTIFGYSSGAICVQLHLLSDMSRGLYHRAVFQSGGAASPFAIQTQPVKYTQKIAEIVDCTTSTRKDMVECLSKVSAEDLVKTLYNFPFWGMRIPLHYRPVIEKINLHDEPFITEDPITLLSEGKVSDVPVITGQTSEENIVFAVRTLANSSILQDLDENFEEIFRHISSVDNLMSSSSVERIREFYLGLDHFDGGIDIEQLEIFFSDSQFSYWSVLSARLQIDAKKNKVYLYNFGFKGRISDTLTINDGGAPYGVGHADDLAYTFRRKVPFPGGPNEEERLTIWRQGKLLANFAETGDPTPFTTKEIPVRWEPMKSGDYLNYLSIGKELEMVEEPLPGRYLLWDSLIEKDGLIRNRKLFMVHEEL